MERSDLLQLLPLNAKDVERAKSLVALGYPRVAAAIPSMIKYLRVYQSEVAKVFCEFFVKEQNQVHGQIGTALGKTKDPYIKTRLLTDVVCCWREENIRHIHPALCSVVATTTVDYSHTDLIALNLLVKHGLSTEFFRRNWIESKEQWLQERAADLANLRATEFSE